MKLKLICLNPYCSGQWFRTASGATMCFFACGVLILIVVDNGFVLMHEQGENSNSIGLNPYCSGQWFRTNFVETVSLEEMKS